MTFSYCPTTLQCTQGVWTVSGTCRRLVVRRFLRIRRTRFEHRPVRTCRLISPNRRFSEIFAFPLRPVGLFESLSNSVRAWIRTHLRLGRKWYRSRTGHRVGHYNRSLCDAPIVVWWSNTCTKRNNRLRSVWNNVGRTTNDYLSHISVLANHRSFK